MKKLALLLTLLIPALLSSQSCLPEGIDFTTQAQIDNFQINHPGCSEIEGFVRIHGGDINNLNGLTVLTSIGGNLIIGWYSGTNNPLLTSLTGLENLTSIGGSLIFSGNAALIDITSLTNVTSIGGDLTIGGSYVLTSLNGLNNVTSIGGYLHVSVNFHLESLSGLDNIEAGSITNLTISNNDSLSTCAVQSICDYLASPNGVVKIHDNSSGCENPPEIANNCGINLPCLPYGEYYFRTQTEIDSFQVNYLNCYDLEGDVIIKSQYYDAIKNLNGLSDVTSIGGMLSIRFSPDLENIVGLHSVNSIGGALIIKNNWNILFTSLDGLDNINDGSISDLTISANWSLKTCEVQSICDYLVSPNGEVEINSNAPGCNSKQEVEEACETVMVEEISIQRSKFDVTSSPNPFTNSTTIEYQLNTPQTVTITFYNQFGKQVDRIEQKQSAGIQQVVWTPDLPGGVYYFRMEVGEQMASGKVVLVR